MKNAKAGNAITWIFDEPEQCKQVSTGAFRCCRPKIYDAQANTDQKISAF
jgi:hypothetical protein